jgi:hypothetical protein
VLSAAGTNAGSAHLHVMTARDFELRHIPATWLLRSRELSTNPCSKPRIPMFRHLVSYDLQKIDERSSLWTKAFVHLSFVMQDESNLRGAQDIAIFDRTLCAEIAAERSMKTV